MVVRSLSAHDVDAWSVACSTESVVSETSGAGGIPEELAAPIQPEWTVRRHFVVPRLPSSRGVTKSRSPRRGQASPPDPAGVLPYSPTALWVSGAAGAEAGLRAEGRQTS